MKNRFITVAITSAIIFTGNTLLSSPAQAATCTSAICAPNSDVIIDMRRPLNATSPITACEILNNPLVDLVVQIVGGVLQIKWVVTLVPTLVCRLV